MILIRDTFLEPWIARNTQCNVLINQVTPAILLLQSYL